MSEFLSSYFFQETVCARNIFGFQKICRWSDGACFRFSFGRNGLGLFTFVFTIDIVHSNRRKKQLQTVL